MILMTQPRLRFHIIAYLFKIFSQNLNVTQTSSKYYQEYIGMLFFVFFKDRVSIDMHTHTYKHTRTLIQIRNIMTVPEPQR